MTEIAVFIKISNDTIMNQLNKSILQFNPREGISLPKIDKTTRHWLRFHSLLPNRLSKKQISKRLGFSDKVEFSPGFNCLAGKVVCKGKASLCDTLFVDYASVVLEDGVSFGYRNMVLTSSHAINDFNAVEARPIHIGANAWITCGVIILGGVNIGENSIIGSGSVVTRDIPPNVIAAGNPCKIIRNL